METELLFLLAMGACAYFSFNAGRKFQVEEIVNHTISSLVAMNIVKIGKDEFGNENILPVCDETCINSDDKQALTGENNG